MMGTIHGEEMMLIGGLEFPYDRTRSTSGHGPVGSFMCRIHPLAMWIPAAIIGAIVGYLR
jgi:hypothetical protein